MNTKTCPVCSKTFERRHYEYQKRWEKRRTCSPKCRTEASGKPIRIGIIREGGLTLEEIAIVADLSVGNVCNIYNKAVAKIRSALG